MKTIFITDSFAEVGMAAFNTGDILNVPDEFADRLISNGRARLHDTKPERKREMASFPHRESEMLARPKGR